ncbi:hypothetical protein ACEK07_32685 [Alcanivoracaceae bacterium MT1]
MIHHLKQARTSTVQQDPNIGCAELENVTDGYAFPYRSFEVIAKRVLLLRHPLVPMCEPSMYVLTSDQGESRHVFQSTPYTLEFLGDDTRFVRSDMHYTVRPAS